MYASNFGYQYVFVTVCVCPCVYLDLIVGVQLCE